ncbi:sugar phosphate isomerase/epimerase family protein [uncultured Sphaerochaeta sp.]|uniref:sugar phosphate isomerase/epimerase family protein n=1 Tax=uncultured Sphaerochaeta sp. TaxID=886478 RepID=UPI002A0A9FF8|nr:sugar phosphate isomerase/epimerase family protein [uncultured Sphaerochaeta sp.]
MYNPKYSVILGNVGACCDRYMAGGYSAPYSIDEMFNRVASIENVRGVELVGTWHVTADNVGQIKRNLKEYNLQLVSIIPDHFGTRKWGRGAFCSKDSGIRKEAVAVTKEMVDIAKELGGNLISLWPGQDGYDYYWEGDYIQERTWFEEGLAACADYDPNVRISLEYKPKEPRNRSYASTVYSTLLMVQAVNRKNLGVTIDYGHATTAYENVAESIAVLKMYGDKLFHLHMNDNYGYWDDDMILGSIHSIPFVEMCYWIKKTNYAGWISTDQYPYREDGRDACNETISWLKIFFDIVNRMDDEEVEKVIHGGNAVEGSRLMRKYMFGVQ